MIVMGSVPIKSKRDVDREIKKLWKEFEGKISFEISGCKDFLIYKHYFTYQDLENRKAEEDDMHGNKGA